jgi:beta-lactam-binding protein with PASTA domain
LVRRLIKQEGLRPCFVGHGVRVVAADPPAGTICPPGTKIELVLSADPQDREEIGTLGDFHGLSLRDALSRARWHGLPVEVQGSGWVVSQSPSATTPLEAVKSVRLHLAPDSCRAFVEWLGAPQ